MIDILVYIWVLSPTILGPACAILYSLYRRKKMESKAWEDLVKNYKTQFKINLSK